MSEEIKEVIEALPKTNNTISTYESININELYKTIEKFKKVPDYNELMKDNNNLQQKVEQLENIRKEAIELCDEMLSILYHYDDRKVWEDMKDILNKGSEE